MKIYVNNQQLIVDENYTVEKLLEKHGIERSAAVWINGKQILLKNYSSKQIQYGDEIKIIRIVGGG